MTFCVAQIACEKDINDNVIFKWLRLWQNEGRMSCRLPVTIKSSPSPAMLPVEVIPEPTPSYRPWSTLRIQCRFLLCRVPPWQNGTGEPSPELLALLRRELIGRCHMRASGSRAALQFDNPKLWCSNQNRFYMM